MGWNMEIGGFCLGYGASDEAAMLVTQVLLYAVQNKRESGLFHLDFRRQKKNISDEYAYLNSCDRTWVLEELEDLRINLDTRPEFEGESTSQLYYSLTQLLTKLRGITEKRERPSGSSWLQRKVQEHVQWLQDFREEGAEMKWRLMQCQIDPGSDPACQRMIDSGMLQPALSRD